MQWFEYIIILFAVGIVILPFVLAIKNKKNGKNSCGCNCSYCHDKDACASRVKKIINDAKASINK